MLKLCVGSDVYNGREYEYIYVNVVVNGVETKIKLKPYSAFEKQVLINEILRQEGKK